MALIDILVALTDILVGPDFAAGPSAAASQFLPSLARLDCELCAAHDCANKRQSLSL